MYCTEYECSVITPMLLHGGDGKTPELRAPSIKGAMRFWWRAIELAKSETENIKERRKEIFEREKILFGSVSGGSLKSSFSIVVESDCPPKNALKNEYSVKGLAVGTKFTVRFIVPKKGRRTDGNGRLVFDADGQNILTEIEKLFEILSVCGGLGMRSRRGFGAFCIEKKNSEKFSVNTALVYVNEIKEKLKKKKSYVYTELLDIQYDYNQGGTSEKTYSTVSVRTAIDSGVKAIWGKYEVDVIGRSLGQIPDKKKKEWKRRLASPVIVSVFRKDKNDEEGKDELVLIYSRVYSNNADEKLQKDFINSIKSVKVRD